MEAQMDSMEALLDVDEVARRLCVSKRWLYEQTRLGEFPHVRIARRLLFRPADIRAYIESHTRGPR